MKTITITDAFISDHNQIKLLNNFLLKINHIDPILLITNSILDESVINKVDYLFYDKNNNLFEKEYNNYEKFYLWNIVNNFKITTCHVHKQKHGLSVLINLFRSLKIAKDLGYTHFRRIEYDALLGNNTLQELINTPKTCFNNNKKAQFYVNEDNKTHSFQYFFSEIDFFLNNFPEIKNEDDYINLINKEYSNLDFVTVEKLMYYYINKLNKKEINIEPDLLIAFNDTIWNQSSSDSHLHKSMVECSTDLYKQENKIMLFTLNKKNKPLHRKVTVYYNNEFDVFNYNFNNEGDWTLNEVKENISKLEIYDNNFLVFSKDITNIENYLEVL